MQNIPHFQVNNYNYEKDKKDKKDKEDGIIKGNDEDKDSNKDDSIYQKPIKRRKALYKDFDKKQLLFRPEYRLSSEDSKRERMWELMDIYLPRDTISIQKSIVTHIEYTLATSRFEIDEGYVFQGTALSVRDRLLESWNDTQLFYKINNPKKIYYLSIEFLLGRFLQNALLNIELEQCYKDALYNFGYSIEQIYSKENDPALGNGGLGRLVACYIDSMATLCLPAWSYGIRYDYGIFKQAIENYEQKELPDYWLIKGNPWEIMRLDTKYKVRFYGYCRDEEKEGKKQRIWEGGEEVLAVPHDTAVPGFKTFNCNTLRLWKSFPSEEFDLESFNKGQYHSALEHKDHAAYITSVLYPNDSNLSGKELRLKQEYFFSSATIQNIVTQFKRLELSWEDFPKFNCIQLNDTHPALAILEFLRILIDQYNLEYKDAFNIVHKTFNYTNHSVLPEAHEKWGVDLLERILPRHLELAYLLNYYFLEDVRKKYPDDNNKLSNLSLIEESSPKQLRMANLCVVSAKRVNGVAKIHSSLLQKTIFKDFYEMWPKKFMNVTNGVTPRRWIHCAFPELSALYTKYNSNEDEWLVDLSLIDGIFSSLEKEQKKEFIEEFKQAKLSAKLRMKKFIKEITGISISETFMYDIMVKRIHEYKRQFMNILYCIYRYNLIKKSPIQIRNKFIKRVTFFGGKAAPGYEVAKNVIKFINMVGEVINNDKDVNDYFKVIFIPDYKVSTAQIVIPSADINQQISTAGMEASGTSCMKFVMTGSLILGTRDGANIEIGEKIGEDNIFFFGKNVKEVQQIRIELQEGKRNYVGNKLKEVFDMILENRFGDTSFFHGYVKNLINGGDYYLLCHDFDDYISKQEIVDKEYINQNTWVLKCIHSMTKMGYFSSDRAVKEYAERIWKVKPLEVPKPSLSKREHYVSNENLNKIK